MTILITGASGVLGRELKRLIPEALAPSSIELNVSSRLSISHFITRHRPDMTIHCAAKTSIRWCEENRTQAWSVNTLGVKHLTLALEKYAKKPYFVYISTACVFPGDDLNKFYEEDDLRYPSNFYGLTKTFGEYFAEKVKRALIIRTNFARRGPWNYPSAFTDRYGTYLYPDQVAQAVTQLMQKQETGVFHVCGDRRMSMYEFAKLADKVVKPMTLKDYVGPPLTINMCLKSTKIAPVHFQA